MFPHVVSPEWFNCIAVGFLVAIGWALGCWLIAQLTQPIVIWRSTPPK